MIVWAILFLLPFTPYAWILSGEQGDKWDNLKLTWDMNPLDDTGFNEMPRTSRAAVLGGFTLDTDNCDATASKPFLGHRYTKDGDSSAMLVFDRNGFIAGIQVGIPKNVGKNYPPVGIQPPFVEMGNKYIMTAYFVNPATICRDGRTRQQFSSQGTGTDLYLQNGTDPVADSISIPLTEAELANTLWTGGRCFKTMGVFYWYNITRGMSCDHFLPVFLLYNNGKLNGFGWFFTENLESERYEHPPRGIDWLFMKPVPTCLSKVKTTSVLHIFLTNGPFFNWC